MKSGHSEEKYAPPLRSIVLKRPSYEINTYMKGLDLEELDNLTRVPLISNSKKKYKMKRSTIPESVNNYNSLFGMASNHNNGP